MRNNSPFIGIEVTKKINIGLIFTPTTLKTTHSCKVQSHFSATPFDIHSTGIETNFDRVDFVPFDVLVY